METAGPFLRSLCFLIQILISNRHSCSVQVREVIETGKGIRILLADDIPCPVDIRIDQDPVFGTVQPAFHPPAGKRVSSCIPFGIDRDLIHVQQAGLGSVAFLGQDNRNAAFCGNRCQSNNEFCIRDGHKVLVRAVQKGDPMLLSFIMPHDDHFHPCCLGIPADIPCAFIEIVPEKVFPLPAQYIELFAVFNDIRLVYYSVQIVIFRMICGEKSRFSVVSVWFSRILLS